MGAACSPERQEKPGLLERVNLEGAIKWLHGGGKDHALLKKKARCLYVIGVF
jgi:hypothetical protein